jgi:hypothetical protein
LAAVAKAATLAAAQIPYTEARRASNLLMRFLGMADRARVASSASLVEGRRWRVKEENHCTSGAATNCWRTDLEKVRRPNSLLESDPVCSALWYTLGFAIERRRFWERGDSLSCLHYEWLRFAVSYRPWT